MLAVLCLPQLVCKCHHQVVLADMLLNLQWIGCYFVGSLELMNSLELVVSLELVIS